MTGIVTCIACQRFSFKRVPAEHAKQGKGHCDRRAPFIRHDATAERDCEHFRAEARDVVESRSAWLKQHGVEHE